jgi:hypothetical protein
VQWLFQRVSPYYELIGLVLYLYFIGDDEVLIYMYSNLQWEVVISRFGG